MPKAKPKKKITVPSFTSPEREELKKARIVFEYALGSVNKFYELYQTERKGSSGASSHQEQDLLRAMLVFSCSGLDAVVKQLIKDALPKVVLRDKGAQQEFQKYIERRIRKSSSDEKEKIITVDTQFLAEVLLHPFPRSLLVRHLTKHLTDDSLQSKGQLLKVATYFAITEKEILEDPELTQQAFKVRNEIIHEMDVNFESVGSGQKKRHQRAKEAVINYCKNVLIVGVKFIDTVNTKLTPLPQKK